MKKSQSEQKLLPPVVLYRPIGTQIPKEYKQIANQYFTKNNLSPTTQQEPQLYKGFNKLSKVPQDLPSRNTPLRTGGTGGQFTQTDMYKSLATSRLTSTSTKNQFLQGIRDNYVPLTARESRNINNNNNQLRQYSTAHIDNRQSPRTATDNQKNILSQTQSSNLFKFKGKDTNFSQSYVHGHMFENNTIFKESLQKQRLNLHLQHLKNLEQNKLERQQWKDLNREKITKLILKYHLEHIYGNQIDFLVTLPLLKVKQQLKEEYTMNKKQQSAIKLQTFIRMKIQHQRFKMRKSQVIKAVETIQKIWRAIKIYKNKQQDLYNKRSHAATKIQSFIKGQLSRMNQKIQMDIKLKQNVQFFDSLREQHYLPYVKKVIAWWRIRLQKIRENRKKEIHQCFIYWAVKFYKTKIKKYMRQKTNKNKQKMKYIVDKSSRKTKEKLNTSQNNKQGSNKDLKNVNDIGGVIPLYNEKQSSQDWYLSVNKIDQRDNINSQASNKRENFDEISKQAIDKHIEKQDFDKMKKAQLAILPSIASHGDDLNNNPTVVKKNEFQLMSLDIDELKNQIKALDPHFTTSTVSKTINELNITPEEYLRYNQYLLLHQEQNGYLLKHISLIEFVLHDRLKRLSSATIEDQTDKDQYKKFNLEQFQEMRNQIKDPSRNKLLELKRMLNFVLQNDVNKDIGSNYYDLDNYEEEENDQHQTIDEVRRKAMPQNLEQDSQNQQENDIHNAEKMLLKEFNNQVNNRPIVFKPKQQMTKAESMKNMSFGITSGQETTIVNQNDPLVMQNILKSNVRIIRGVGTDEDNDQESIDKIKQIFGQKKQKSRLNSRQSPSKSDTSRLTGTSLDKKSSQTLQSRNKLRVVLNRNQTLPTFQRDKQLVSGQQHLNYDEIRQRINIVKNNFSEKTQLKTPLQQDLSSSQFLNQLNNDLQTYLQYDSDQNYATSNHKFNPQHLDLIEEQTEDEIVYPSTCMALPQRRQTIQQQMPQQFTLQGEKGLYKDEDLIESPTFNPLQLQQQNSSSILASDQLGSNLSNYSPQVHKDPILNDDNNEDMEDSEVASQKFTYLGIYQPVEKPYLKELNKKKNRNRFINRPVAVSKDVNKNQQISDKIGKGIVQKLKQQLTDEEQRYIRRMLGFNNGAESQNNIGSQSARQVGKKESLYEKGKILESISIPPPTSN